MSVFKWYQYKKICQGIGEYLWSSVAFVKTWIKSKSPNGTTGLKNHANVAQKIKPAVIIWHSPLKMSHNSWFSVISRLIIWSPNDAATFYLIPPWNLNQTVYETRNTTADFAHKEQTAFFKSIWLLEQKISKHKWYADKVDVFMQFFSQLT